MRLIPPQLRSTIAALLLVAVPFCCCEGQAVVRALGTLSGVYSVAVSGHHHQSEGEHGQDHSRPHNGCTPGSDGHSAPCDDDGPCDCAQHKQAKQVPESPTTLDLSGTVVHMLPSLDLGFWIPEAPVRTVSSDAAIPRPPTSLLRLHCALII